MSCLLIFETNRLKCPDGSAAVNNGRYLHQTHCELIYVQHSENKIFKNYMWFSTIAVFFNWNQCRATIQKDIFLIHMNFLRNLHFTNDTHPTVLSQLFINSISKIIIRTINIFDGKIFKLIIIIFSTLKIFLAS